MSAVSIMRSGGHTPAAEVTTDTTSFGQGPIQSSSQQMLTRTIWTKREGRDRADEFDLNCTWDILIKYDIWDLRNIRFYNLFFVQNEIFFNWPNSIKNEGHSRNKRTDPALRKPSDLRNLTFHHTITFSVCKKYQRTFLKPLSMWLCGTFTLAKIAWFPPTRDWLGYVKFSWGWNEYYLSTLVTQFKVTMYIILNSARS